MMTENEIQQLVQIEARKSDSLLLRNNSGALKDSTGRLVRYGLGNVSSQHNETMKSSDLIGITSVVVTPDMVGRTLGVFTACEVKAQGWKFSNTKREQAQLNFINLVRRFGGKSGFVQSLDDLKAVIES